MDAAVSNYEVLKAEYPKSAYTSMAAMMMAKARLMPGSLIWLQLTLTMRWRMPSPHRSGDRKGKACTAETQPG